MTMALTLAIKDLHASLQFPSEELQHLDGILHSLDCQAPKLDSAFHSDSLLLSSCALSALHGSLLLSERNSCSPPPIQVHPDECVAAFLSERHLYANSKLFTDIWNEWSGNYEASDGCVRLHCNFKHHQLAVLKAMGLPEDAKKNELMDEIARRKAKDVESAVEAEGGCAAVLMDMKRWRETELYRKLEGSPSISFLGNETFATTLGPSSDGLPLTGIKVLDLTRVLAGPICCRTLAAYGAEVLHVSSENLPGLPGVDLGTLFGKRSCCLDLKTVEGRDRLKELVREADVFVQAYRPGSLDALGFSPSDLAKLKPGIVSVSISAYSVPDDPSFTFEERRGFDSLLQFSSGIASVEGARKGKAHHPLPCQLLDHGTGWMAASATIAGLRKRNKTGEGSHVRVSLARTSVLLDGLGRNDGPSPPQFEVKDFLEEREVEGVGKVGYIRFPNLIPSVKLGWKKNPPARLGQDEARWE
ncbi:hypothetical protein HDU97_007478 [Phlyctochytrium planicorne]|nr:hypothetical protein HDU97_007478 [Phlyctochytrium planicorne]